MDQLRAGFVIAISAAREMLRLWLPYWHVIKPWSLVYIVLTFLYRYRYPQGSQSMLFEILWQGLFFGLSLLMAWNWANALTGKSGRVDLQRGWNDSDFRDYFGGMLMVVVALPLLVALTATIPLIMILVLIYGEAALDSVYSIMAAVSGIVIYFMARLLPASATLVAQQPTPIPSVLKATQPHQFMLMSALFTVLIVQFLSAFGIGTLVLGLKDMGIERADLLALPFGIAVYLFIWGWFILLSQRLYAILQVGRHEPV